MERDDDFDRGRTGRDIAPELDVERPRVPGKQTLVEAELTRSGNRPAAPGKRTLVQDVYAQPSQSQGRDPAVEVVFHVQKARELMAKLAAHAAPSEERLLRADLRCHLEGAKHAAAQCGGDPRGHDAVASVFQVLLDARPFADAMRSTSPEAIAERGIEGAGQRLPYHDEIQRAFGSHDISGIRAHVGGAAGDASRELGAQAYAYGDHVAFAGTPDLHTAAHETAHVVQQRAGVAFKNGEPGDAFEQHADAVADAVVRGHSAESLLSAMAGSGVNAAPSRSVVQRKTGESPQAAAFAPSKEFSRYVQIHAVDLGQAIARQLAKTIWPDPTGDTPFTREGERRFSARLSALMRDQLDQADQLVMMLYPGNALERFQQYVVAPGQLNNLSYKGFGEPLAQLVELAAKQSLTQRIGPRYAQALSQMVRLPTAADLIAGHPIDPLVATALCEDGILEANVAATKDVGPPKLNKVEAHWLGRQNPDLWNFVQATPATASTEEVAAALWADPKKTTMAFAIEKFGDLFRVAPAYARQVLAGRYPGEPIGTSDVDASRAKQMLALAKSSFRHGEAATAQFAHDDQPKTVTAEQIADIEAHIGALLDQIGAQLGRVAMDKLLQPAYAARQERSKVLANADAATRSHWVPVLSFQHTQLLSINSQLPSVVQAYQKVFVVMPFGDTARRREHDDLEALVRDFAAAAGTSHLRDESTAIMRRIDQRQRLAGQNDLDAAAVELHDATRTNEESGGRTLKGNDIGDEAIENQRQVAQNKGRTSQYDRRKALVLAGEHALLARMDSAERSLQQLQAAADAAGFADGEALRRFIPNARSLPEVISDVRNHLSEVHRTWDEAITKNTPEVQEAGSPDGWADWQARETSLPVARSAFAKIAGDKPLGDFIREAVKKIRVQQIVNALVSLAEALLLTVVAGAGAAAIGRAAASLVAEANTLAFAGVEIAASASINSLVQMAVSGDGNTSFGWTMLENGLMDMFTRGLLRPMKNAENAARVEAQEIAALPHLTDAERQAASSASFMGVQPFAELVGGMASQWAARHIVDMAKSRVGSGGAKDEGVSDSFALTALQQGAAIGLGKFFHGRLESWKTHRKQLEQTRFGSLPEARALFAAREEFFNEASRLESNPSPDPAEADRLNQRNVELLKQEHDLLAAHAVAEGAQPLPANHDLEVLTALPVLDRVEMVTGVEKGPAYAKHMAELRSFYEDMEREGQQGVSHKGHASDGAYGWEYGHKAFTFSHGLATFEVRVHLDDSNVVPADIAKLKTQVHGGVDQYYNAQKHQVRGADGVQRQMHVEVIFVDDPQSADIRVMVHPGNGFADLNNWFVGGNPATHAHEVTHGAFGIKDEYHDPTGRAPDRATPTSPGVRTDNSIMGNYFVGDPVRDNTADPRTSVKQRHLDTIEGFSPAAPAKSPSGGTSANVAPPAPEGTTTRGAAKAAAARLANTPVARVPAGTLVESESVPLDHDTYYVTREHGQEMLQALAELDDRGVSTRAYKKGFIVRRGADEWYFEFHDQATTQGAQHSTDVRDEHGLPSPNVATVELWGFRGVRTIEGRPRSEWTGDEVRDIENTKNTDPLLYAGHVGISVDGGKTIVGFTPDKPADMDMPEFMRSLFNHETYPGVVGNDTAVFDRARARAREHGWNTEPVSVVELVDKPAKLKVVEQVAKMSGMKPGEHGGRYGFPLPSPASDGSHFAGSKDVPADCVANCAAWPAKVGVPIPEPSGNLSVYMPELEKWATEDGPKDFRSKKGAGK